MRNEMDEALRNEETKPPHRHTRGHPKERSNPIANLGSVSHRKRSVLSREIKNAWDFEVLPAQSFKVAKSYWFVVTVLVPSLLVRADSDFRVVAKRHQRLRLASRRQRYQPHASLVQNRIPIHADHQCCNEAKDVVNDDSSSPSFCGKNCQELFEKLEMLLGVRHEVEEGFSLTLLRRFDVGDTTLEIECDAKLIECNAKLAVAFLIMDECFLPMVDHRSGVNLIHNILYNRGTHFWKSWTRSILPKDHVVQHRMGLL